MVYAFWVALIIVLSGYISLCRNRIHPRVHFIYLCGSVALLLGIHYDYAEFNLFFSLVSIGMALSQVSRFVKQITHFKFLMLGVLFGLIGGIFCLLKISGLREQDIHHYLSF